MPIHSANWRRSSSVGIFRTSSSGGMSWTITFATAFFQCRNAEPRPGSFSATSKLMFALARPPPWHFVQ
ncbi:MAG: hypothetical protein R3F11_13720 [Verrucomicrobiales bacterium]